MSDELRERRQKIETSRKRQLFKHRLLKVGEVIAWAVGLLWTAVLLRSLFRSPVAPPMLGAALRATGGYAASLSAAYLATQVPVPDAAPPWRLAHVRAGPRPSSIVAGFGIGPHWSPQEANGTATTRNPNEIGPQGPQGLGPGVQPGMTGAAGEAGQGIRSPTSDDAYNVLSALRAKCEGLKTYRKYSRDGDQCIWNELSDRDNEAVRLLCEELERLVPDRRPGMGQSGKPAH